MPKSERVRTMCRAKLQRGSTILFALFAFGAGAQEDAVRYEPEHVYVIQRPSSWPESRLGISLLANGRIDSKYVGEKGVAVALAYNLAHNVALQLSGAWQFWRSQSLVARNLAPVKDRSGRDLKSPSGDVYAFSPPLDEYFRTPWFALLEMQIAPIFGKIAISSEKLAYFQLFGCVGFGASGVELTDPLQTKAQSKDILVEGYPRRVAFLGSYGVGAHLMFNERFGLVLEVKDLVQARYVKREEIDDNLNGYVTTGQVSHSWMSQMGVKYVF